mmetsp:Transcript_81804/g.227807  ORF Transcript_81804/g.227807 Transcript_81804/m.227807 type:complete len:223 (-) Transcript_81804:1090-1758(-)
MIAGCAPPLATAACVRNCTCKTRKMQFAFERPLKLTCEPDLTCTTSSVLGTGWLSTKRGLLLSFRSARAAPRAKSNTSSKCDREMHEIHSRLITKDSKNSGWCCRPIVVRNGSGTPCALSEKAKARCACGSEARSKPSACTHSSTNSAGDEWSLNCCAPTGAYVSEDLLIPRPAGDAPSPGEYTCAGDAPRTGEYPNAGDWPCSDADEHPCATIGLGANGDC